MPVSKHFTKKMSNRERKKLSNTRKSIRKYLESKKRAKDAILTKEQRDAKFNHAFPRTKDAF